MGEMDRIIEKCIVDSMPSCQATCPLHIDVRGYIGLIRDGKLDEALKLIKEKLPFPKIIARVCTHPCETKCKRWEVDESIAINSIKRATTDHGKGMDEDFTIIEEKKERIAIVGGGPAGLMAAHDLRKMGYQVTIFEALPFLGGMLRKGIPQYRLPRDTLNSEVSIIQKLGVEVRLNTRIGIDVKLSELRQNFDATFITTGAHIDRELGIKNWDGKLEGCLGGVEFLRKVNLGEKVEDKDRVVIVGGGNVAIDCSRTCLRLGYGDVTILYRRSRVEMPGIKEEVEEAEKEGVKINFLVTPTKVLAENSRVVGVECVRTKLDKPDASGRRLPVPIEGSEFVVKTDTIISAIGEKPDLSLLEDSGIQSTKEGFIHANEVTLETNVHGIFAGGDVVTGPATVIDALAAGRKAAISIDCYIKGNGLTIERGAEGTQESELVVSIENISTKPRQTMPTLPVEERRGNFGEVELGFSPKQAKAEAERCLFCECKLCVKECEFLKRYCETPKELAEKFKSGFFRENPLVPYSCNLCGLCKKLCPQELDIGEMCLAIRQKLVAEGLGPLPQHKLVRKDQEWSTSDSVTLAQGDPTVSECKRVFFPGCALSGYSPELVTKVYSYLREKLPGTGIILGCCGAPTHFLGDQSRFGEILGGVEDQMKRLGASELIAACPDCYHTIKHHSSHIKLRSIIEIIDEQGLPENMNAIPDKIFSLHDSCKARWEKDWLDSARSLVKKMGYQIEEMLYSREKTRCCGMGGMVPYVDFDLASMIIKKRADEASHDILTYCAGCREALAFQKPAIHILDLIFNPNWEEAKLQPPKTGKIRRENQAKLKTLIQEKVSSK